jgi:hypothetical protein
MAPEDQRFAYVESPLTGRGGIATTMKQAYVGGVIRACLVEAGFTVYDAHPSTWRSTLGMSSGRGRTTAVQKIDAFAAVEVRDAKLSRLVAGDGDLTDAAAIALHGVEQVRKAGVIGDALAATGSLQGGGPAVVVRPSRVRPGVRRR